jgi:hypothetical protein
VGTKSAKAQAVLGHLVRFSVFVLISKILSALVPLSVSFLKAYCLVLDIVYIYSNSVGHVLRCCGHWFESSRKFNICIYVAQMFSAHSSLAAISNLNELALFEIQLAADSVSKSLLSKLPL